MSEAVRNTPPMTVEEFVEWAEGRPGRYELHHGEVVTSRSERVVHVLVKTGVLLAFRAALGAAGSSCRAFGDGVTVKVDARTAFEPDCTIHCGPIELDSLHLANPVVVVEVVSPSSHASDFTKKLPGYFRIASIMHYLIVDPDRRMVIHQGRNGAEVTTRFLHVNETDSGQLVLHPPGITIQVAAFFAELDIA